MKKAFAAAVIFAILAALVPAFMPAVMISSAPVCETISASVQTFCETVDGAGEFSYSVEHEITCSLPVVIERIYVAEGDEVAVGDTVALVDKKSSAAFIESLGQINMAGFAAADLGTAVSLIPETITADCAGRVISTCGTGSAVQSGSGIVTVAQDGELGIVAAVSELDIAKVELGQSAIFSPAAYPGEEFHGTVTAISSAARSRYSGTVLETVVDVTITPDVPDSRFKSGLSADVSIILSEPAEIVVLPYYAIEQDDDGEYVYVYENGQALRRNIVTGEEFAEVTEIRSGVSAADVIFADPQTVSESRYIRVEGEDV